MKTITLNVVDNCFNANKAQILFEYVADGSLTGFVFVNHAGPYDFNSNEYSSFD